MRLFGGLIACSLENIGQDGWAIKNHLDTGVIQGLSAGGADAADAFAVFLNKSQRKNNVMKFIQSKSLSRAKDGKSQDFKIHIFYYLRTKVIKLLKVTSTFFFSFFPTAISDPRKLLLEMKRMSQEICLQ